MSRKVKGHTRESPLSFSHFGSRTLAMLKWQLATTEVEDSITWIT